MAMWDRYSDRLDGLIGFGMHALCAWAGVLFVFAGAGFDPDAAGYVAILVVLAIYAGIGIIRLRAPEPPLRRRGRQRWRRLLDHVPAHDCATRAHGDDPFRSPPRAPIIVVAPAAVRVVTPMVTGDSGDAPKLLG
jgi:hypothetical protein